MNETTVPAAPPRASFVEDFIDIFYAPSDVFERRRHASFWPALLVVTGLFAILTYVGFRLLGPAYDAEVTRQLAKAAEQNPQMTAQQLEAGRGFARIMMMVGPIVGTPIMVLILGLLLWVVGKLFDAKQALGAAMLVVTLSFMPRILEALLTAIQGLVLDPTTMTSIYAVSLSPARFVDVSTTSMLVVGILARLDPFIIWSYVIVAIGLAVTGGIPRSKAAIAAFILWLLGTLPAILGGLRG